MSYESYEDINIRDLTPEKVQEILAEALKNNRPIDIGQLASDTTHGDRLITAWALKQVVLARFPGSNPRFTFNLDPDKRAPNAIDIGGKMDILAREHRSPSESYREWELSRFAEVLGVNLQKKTLKDKVPTPVHIEGDRVFGNFNIEKMRQQSQELKQTKEWAGRPIVVIFQAGSIPEKRFSDEQLSAVIDVVKKKTPDAVILVVTDKAVLNRTNFPNEKMSPPYAYSQSAEAVITAESLDTVGALAMAADQIITTDTLWAWWGAGCKAVDGEHQDGTLRQGELIELMTVAGKEWQIPGSQAVFSEAITSGKIKKNQLGMITNAMYRQHSSATQRGIVDKDFQAFLKAIPPARKNKPAISLRQRIFGKI